MTSISCDGRINFSETTVTIRQESVKATILSENIGAPRGISQLPGDNGQQNGLFSIEY
jgi:hypothetical protein